MIEKKDMALSLAQRLLLLLCLFLVCYILTAAASYLLGRLLVGRPAAALRISAMLQDVLTFIVPAVITAVMVTRRPAELLCLRGKASVRMAPHVRHAHGIGAGHGCHNILERPHTSPREFCRRSACHGRPGRRPHARNACRRQHCIACRQHPRGGHSRRLFRRNTFPRMLPAPSHHRRRKPPCGHMDSGIRVQRTPHAGLRIRPPHVARSLLRLSPAVVGLHCGCPSRPMCSTTPSMLSLHGGRCASILPMSSPPSPCFGTG